jgi:hypothetical protein
VEHTPVLLVVKRRLDTGSEVNCRGGCAHPGGIEAEKRGRVGNVASRVEVMIISAWSTEPFDLGNGGEARNVDGIWADGNFFRVLQIQPVLGRVD